MQRQIRKVLLFLLVTSCLVIPVSSQSRKKSVTGANTALVTGTIPSNGGTFSGLLNINNFAVQNGVLTAVGTLTGTLLDNLGNAIERMIDLPIAIPVTATQATCPILTLTLGPLHLNLLGLVVDLNQVVLNITAVPGN